MSIEPAIFCLDIGGTAVKSAVLTGESLTGVSEVPTPADGPAVVRLVAKLVAACPGAAALGVGTAGELDRQSGAIRLSDNIPGYTGLPLKRLLEESTGLPVYLENDVNAAALGELRFGAARKAGLESFLMVSFGTGIGGAIVQNGRVCHGAAGSAGEVGGLITHPEAVNFEDQGSGSYERYASTAALVRRGGKLSKTLGDGRAIFAAMDDVRVQALVRGWAEEIAYGLAGAVHLLDPGAVVLGGGIMQEPLLQQAIAQKLTPLLKPSFRHTRLLYAQLGNQAALYGAGDLARRSAGIP